MKSEDYFYYKNGLSTKEIMKKICSAWKLKLKYNYGSIKNKRIKPVQKSIGDMMVYAKNSRIYKLEEGKNVISVELKLTLDDVVTKIKIYGEEKKNSIPKLATLSKNTSQYGTIQEIMDKDKKEKLSKVKKTAQKKLKENAKAKHEYTITAISNPRIKRGDTVYIGCGTAGIKGNRVAKNITHDCVAGTMDITLY